MQMEKGKFHAIDICKLWMAVCVVAIHTHPLEGCTVNIVNDLYDSLVGLAVPFFFLSSGFLLAQKFDDSWYSAKSIAAVKSYLRKIIKMYVLWTVIYLPMAVYHYVSSEQGVMESVLKYIRGFLFVGEQYNSWHLWYLLSTVYALVYMIALLSFKLSPGKIMAVSSGVFLVSIGMTYLSTYQGDLPAFAALLSKLIQVSVSSGRILTGMFYVSLGIILSRKQPDLKISWLMLTGGYILNVFVENRELSTLLEAVSAIGFFCVIRSVGLPDSGLYPFVRKMSTVIYFIHMYVWSFYYMLVYGQKTYGFDSFAVTTVVCLGVAAVTVAITNQHNQKRKNHSMPASA